MSKQGESWRAYNDKHIKIDEGAGKLVWVEIDAMLGTPESFRTVIRDQIIADHNAARQRDLAVSALREIIDRRGMSSLYGWEQDVAYAALAAIDASQSGGE